MADYWQQKDTSRPEDEWQLPIDHPDNPENPESQGNKLKEATQALSDRLAQEKHSLGKRDELMVFTYQGDLERVRFVLKAERAPDINMRDFGGYNLVALAAEAGHVDILREVAQAGASIDNVDYRGHAPIHHAALHDHVECAHELVRRRASLDVRDRSMGQTALHVACKEGHDRILRLLLDGGARTDLNDFKDRSFREIAEWFGHSDCVRLLDLHRPKDERPKIDQLYLANLIPERATAPLEPFKLLDWLASDPGLDVKDPRLLEAMERLHRSKYRSRYAIARADLKNLRELGLRGSDATRVHKRALAELPDAVDEGVLAANQKVEDEKAKQLLMKAASELLDTDERSVAEDERSVASQASKASQRSMRSRRRSGAPSPPRRRSQGSVDGNLTSL